MVCCYSIDNAYNASHYACSTVHWFQRLFARRKKREARRKEPLVTSVANLTSYFLFRPDRRLHLIRFIIWWPFVKICQTGLGNKHYCKLIMVLSKSTHEWPRVTTNDHEWLRMTTSDFCVSVFKSHKIIIKNYFKVAP
jgi:hypothetical protein